MSRLGRARNFDDPATPRPAPPPLPVDGLAAYRTELAAKVRALPDHSVTGYEWDCAASEPYTDDGTYRDDTGQVCPHYDDEGAISRAAVLALIEGRA